MNENTQVGLPVPERVWKKHTHVYSRTAITRAKHVAVKVGSMTDP